MYLILSDADGNATPEVFHDGVDVIRLRVAGEEKGRRKRSAKEGWTEKIRRRRSSEEDPVKKYKQRMLFLLIE